MSTAIKSTESADADSGRPARLAEEAAPPSAPLPSPGETLTEDLVLVRVVYTGPVATSVHARRTSTGELELVKLIHPAFSTRDDVARRLSRLTQQQSAIHHPNLAGPLRDGKVEARLFLSRPWIEGKNLRQVAQEGFTVRALCAGLCDVLSALSEAHRFGLVHGNLKPENILVATSRSGEQPWTVCDFGQGRLLRPLAESALSPEGVVCGAPAYMAPEQADGRDIDGRADVYAVGAILHELLTGEPPFQSQSTRGLLEAHRLEPLAPLRQRFPDRAIARELEAVCMQALAKSVEDRYASARAMAEALRNALELMRGLADAPLQSAARPSVGQMPQPEHDRLTLPNEPLRSKTKIWLGAALTAVAGVALLLWPESSPKDSGSPQWARMIGNPNPAGELDEARGLLTRGESEVAVQRLVQLRRERGDDPGVLRLLGEALIREQRLPEGKALLRRYLELTPGARDRAVVETLLARE